ncbi:DUF421 domain-containing protein [Bacillus sp. FJAT-47783]|uniref:DUF421 domain-containing protein n=1 Tax=Bacillus sp. FJAT-47783 TaxID=2922712 RepID=UPI001FAB47A8|nr:DUF421 domain-containing protein [Bacillus sp. FJAT-47783]
MAVEFFKIGIDLILGFVSLFFLTKLLGKTQLNQITTFDFISAMVLGELVGNAVYDQDVGIGKIIFAVFLWGALIYGLEFITQKWKGTRSFLEGQPTLVIHKGKIIREKMTENKLDMNQLQQLLRAKGAFSIKEVEYAVLETNGTISVMKKPQYDFPVREDFKIHGTNLYLTSTFIIDGELVIDNLHQAGFNEDWLLKELRKKHIHKIQDVFYAEWNPKEGLHVQAFD